MTEKKEYATISFGTERNGRKYTVDGAHVAMVEMYQAYRGEKIW